MPLWERQYIQPLTMRDVHWIAYDCRARPDGPAVLEAFLASVLDRYEAHRAARRHDGPPLQAVRLYREYWQARPGVIPPAPARRTLVAEFRTEAP